MTDDMRDEDYAALAGFRYELRQFLRFSQQEAAAAGLTGPQHQALLAVRASPTRSMRVGELAERLLLRPHSATGLIDRLETLELVRRAAGGADRRGVTVLLTAQAEALLDRLSTSHRAELRRLQPLLAQLDRLAREPR